MQKAAVYQPQETTSQMQKVAVYQPQISPQIQNADTYQLQTTSPANSYTINMEKSQELFFSNEDLLVNWLRTRPDLITKAQDFLPYKVCFLY
jgi:hypothetical protein